MARSAFESDEEVIKKMKKKKDVHLDEKPPLREFYVYRGEMQVEVISKLRAQKKSKRVKSTEDENGAVDKPAKTTRKPKTAKEAKEPKVKNEKKGKEKPGKKRNEVSEKPMSTLERILNLEAKLDEPVLVRKSKSLTSRAASTDTLPKGSPEKSKRQTLDYDRLFADLESRLALEAWKSQAASMATFDPQKFPSALRDLTGTLAICYLRAATPHHDEIEDVLFEALGDMVPYSAGSLKKVTFKKILPLFLQEIEKKLMSLYACFILQLSELTAPTSPQPTAPESIAPDATSKCKVKFAEGVKQLIYEIVRFELDTAYIEQALKEFDSSESSTNNGTTPLTKLPGEMMIRKSIYQKMHKALPAHLQDHISTNELSLQYGMHKRKIERKILKDHGVEVKGELMGEKRKAPAATAMVVSETADQTPVESAAKRVGPDKPDVLMTDAPPHPHTSPQAQLLTEMLFPVEEARPAQQVL